MTYIGVEKVGVELEAGFEKTPNVHGFEWTHDGSVHTQHTPLEMVSVPFSITKLKALKNRLLAVERQIKEVNNTMGFHVHVSVPPHIYSELATTSFFYFFIERVKKYAEKTDDIRLLARFKNSYCEPKTTNQIIHKQMSATRKESWRYRAINYCYSTHRTIEFRIFPAQPNNNFKYVKLVLSTISKYLLKTEEKTKFTKIISVGKAEEEVTIHV